MIVKKEKKRPVIILVIIGLFVFYFVMRLMTAIDNGGGEFKFELLNETLSSLYILSTPLIFSRKNIKVAVFATLIAFMIYECVRLQNKKNMQEYTYGSAEWQRPSVLKHMKSAEFENNIILTATEQISKNMKVSGMTRHIIMIGRPGTGKSRYVFKPNILNATGTLAITDPKGELLRDCGMSLIRKGYDIKVLNLDKKNLSNHYNPFMYIRKVKKTISDSELEKFMSEETTHEKTSIKEDDVMILINCIMKNTKSDMIDTQTGDPFWEKSELLFLQSLFYYILEEYKDRPQKQNFTTLLELIRNASPDSTGMSNLDRLFQIFETKNGSNHIAVKQYKHFKVAAESKKMMSTIIMTATARLSCFNIKEVADLTDTDDMELDRIGMPIGSEDLEKVNAQSIKKSKNGRVAYFVITKPSDNTFNFIASLMYTQIFQMIDSNAERCASGLNSGLELATPFDMYLDEFAQLGEIPLFQEELAYVRGLNVGIVICLQSLSQLKKMYKDTWETILDCCDTNIFLGSNSKETLDYYVSLLGKKTWYKKSSGRTFARQGSSNQNWDVVGRELATLDELAKLGKGNCLLYIANIGFFFSKVYKLKKHPNYKDLYEPWKKKTKANEYKHNPAVKDAKAEGEYMQSQLELMGLPVIKVMPKVSINDITKAEEVYIKNGGGMTLEQIKRVKES